MMKSFFSASTFFKKLPRTFRLKLFDGINRRVDLTIEGFLGVGQLRNNATEIDLTDDHEIHVAAYHFARRATEPYTNARLIFLRNVSSAKDKTSCIPIVFVTRLLISAKTGLS